MRGFLDRRYSVLRWCAAPVVLVTLLLPSAATGSSSAPVSKSVLVITEFHLRTKSDAGGIERNRYRPSLSEVVLNGYHFCSSRVTLTLCTKRATAASLQVPDHSPVSAAMKGCQIRQKCSCLKLKIRIRNRWPAEANDRNLVSVGSHVL